MIERETRRYEIHSIESPDHPDFERAYRVLWQGFGPAGEMEPLATIRGFLERDPFEPLASGTFIRYFLIVAQDRDGNLRGVRDGSVLYNAAWAPDLCLVYLSHIFMLPEARGTVLTYWLRIAPMDIAITYLHLLHQIVTTVGVPEAVYHDRHTIFVAPRQQRESLQEQLAGEREPGGEERQGGDLARQGGQQCPQKSRTTTFPR